MFLLSPLLSVPHPTVPSSSLPAFQPQGVSGFYPPDSSLLPSSSLTWPVSSAPGWGSPPLVSVVPCLPAVLCLVLRYCLLPLFALLLLAPLRVSMALPLRCLGLLRLLVYMQFCSRVLQGFQRPLLLLLLRCSSCLRCGSLWLSLSFGLLLH